MTLHRPWRLAFSKSTLLFWPSIALLIRLGLPRTRLNSEKSCEFLLGGGGYFLFFLFGFRESLGKIIIIIFGVLTKENVIWMPSMKTLSGIRFVGEGIDAIRLGMINC